VILGIHHVTAIAEDAQKNVDFYVKVLGLRMIKKTVNFDDPGVYHLYYGDGVGTPGTLMTFFVYRQIRQGVRGQGETVSVTFEVPVGSLDRWRERLARLGVTSGEEEIFGKRVVWALDPDGLRIELEEVAESTKMDVWSGSTVPAEDAIRTIRRVTVAPFQVSEGNQPVRRSEELFTELFGWESIARDSQESEARGSGFRERFRAGVSEVDVLRDPSLGRRLNSAGTIHHIAFRNADSESQEAWLATLLRNGVHATPVQERNYFRSIYFREPGGVLFEFATDGPGFLIDETYETLGQNLMLPPQVEDLREQLNEVLQEIDLS
jgi:glyoxalase family protein